MAEYTVVQQLNNNYWLNKKLLYFQIDMILGTFWHIIIIIIIVIIIIIIINDFTARHDVQKEKK